MKSLISQFGKDEAELAFRILFCLIFIGLGGEHLVSDELIQNLMPSWIPAKRVVSILCGSWLMFWGMFILLGYQLRVAAIALGSFVILVTLLVHVPGVLMEPALPADYTWMWTVLQRSNLVKNLCLLGVCFLLLYHEPGKYSVHSLLSKDTSKADSKES
ncbi:MAG: DoxX family protein [Bdellovibrionales bacterium]|nr:DoxX family protein [Bdellovibrionales bacterium]